MSSPEFWPTDNALFASLPGGQAVITWFGFCPSFHDGILERVTLSKEEAFLVIRCFRMTDQIDPKGFYVLDRHALVTLRMNEITGVKLDGDASSIISNLSIRRLATTPDRSEWQTCNGPVQGDVEISWATSIGLYGSIYSKRLEFDLQPLAGAASA